MPALLVVLVLVPLAFLLPTGLEDSNASNLLAGAQWTPSTDERRLAGIKWAAGALVVLALVTLLFAVRAGRWKPELSNWGYAFFGWLAVLAGGVLITIALPIYMQSAPYTEGWAALLALPFVAGDLLILLFGLAGLGIAVRDPRKVSAFRAGACAFGLSSMLFLLAALRFIR